MKKFTLEKTCPVRFILLEDLTKTFQVLEYNLSFTMYTGVSKLTDDAVLEAQKQQNVSFAKAITFVEGVLHNSIMFVLHNNEFDVDAMFKGIDNNFIAVPDPGENMLCAMIHSKLNTISGPDTVVEVVKLQDTSENMMYEYIHDEDEPYAELPSTESWVKEFSYWDTPWWYRNDISTADKVAKDEAEFENWKEQFDEVTRQNTETLVDIEREISEAWNKVSNPKTGELIEVDFGNKKIEPKNV